jgi:hypoxanthine phosphoribosyltransferase
MDPLEPAAEMLWDGATIRETVDRLAEDVLRWTGERSLKSLNLVSVLEGARPFARDLAQALGKRGPALALDLFPVRVRATRGTELLGERFWRSGDLEPAAFRGRTVLLADDLVDSGRTLASLKGALLAMGAVEVKTAVLVRKFGPAGGPADFCGFDLGLDRRALARQGLKDRWLFGYGMDLEGRHRELDYIGWTPVR